MKRLSICLWLIVQFLILNSNNLFAEEKSLFQIEPYLLNVTQETAVIAFHLREAFSAKVKVTTAKGFKEFSSLSNRSHFIQVTGLEPGMSYQYEVSVGEGDTHFSLNDPSYQIKTASLSGKSFVFTVYGDPRPGENATDRYHKSIINQMLYHDPAFSLVLGDMVDHGEDPFLWENFFGIESKMLRRTAIYPVFGDNDYANNKGLVYKFFPMFNKGFYRFSWGGVQFFALNAWDTRGTQSQSEVDAKSEQIAWFKSELKKDEVQNAPFRIVFMHDPVYISRGKSSEILKRIWAPIFQEHKVDVVFSSWHLYERSNNQGVNYILSGGGGAELIWMPPDPDYKSLADAQAYHFCLVDVQSDAMRIRSIGIDGTVLDEILLTPKTKNLETSHKIENIAKRLQKEILINKGDQYQIITLNLFAYDCSFCKRLLNVELPKLARKNRVTLRVIYFDLSVKDCYGLFLNAGEEFGRQGAGLPAVFIGRSVYGGQTEIEQGLEKEILTYLKNPNDYQRKTIVPFRQSFDTKEIRENTFNALTLGIVTSAGFLDGLNPCAFATIIFLISYLNLFGIGQRQMMYIGSLFVLAVFLTYLGIGLLFYHYLKYLLMHSSIISGVYFVLFVIVCVLGIISFIDFIACIQGRKAEVTLQLPNIFKIKIQDHIRRFAGKKSAMIGAPFILGMFISLLELTCTGQVYIPIVAMIADPSHRMTALYYLIIYNLAFIIPLIIVFVFAFFGITFSRMAKSKYYMASVKGIHVLFYLTMAGIMLLNLGWI